MSKNKSLVDHDEDFTAINYMEALDIDNEMQEYKNILKNLIEMLPSNGKKKTLHDVGCGTGHFINLATESGFKTSGNDTWDQMIFLAKKSGCNVYLGTFNPRKHKELNAATMLCVLAHMDNPWTEIREIIGSLNKDGILYFHTPRMCLIDFIAIACLILSGTLSPALLMRRVSKSHRRIYSRKALFIELEKIGLKIVQIEKRKAYGLKYKEYLTSLGLSKNLATKLAVSITKIGLDRFFPKNRWSVYCTISK